MKYFQLLETPSRFDEPPPVESEYGSESMYNYIRSFIRKCKATKFAHGTPHANIDLCGCQIIISTANTQRIRLAHQLQQLEWMFMSHIESSDEAMLEFIKTRKRVTVDKHKHAIEHLPYSAMEYVHRFTPGHRWAAAEACILQEPIVAAKYAYYAIGDRWPEAERVIFSDNRAAGLYTVLVLREPDSRVTPLLTPSTHLARRYAQWIEEYNNWEEAVGSVPRTSAYMTGKTERRMPAEYISTFAAADFEE